MKLNVDFRALDAAVRRMGAEPVAFTVHREVQPLDPVDVKLGQGIEIDLKDVETKHGLLSYQGRQVLLYIQDHGGRVQEALDNSEKGKKFHVADCKTLKTMRAKGRYERYVVTNRLDGVFYVTGKDWHSGRQIEGETRLWVCRNCLKTLNYQGAGYGNNHELARTFDIGEFFSTYSSFFTHLPQRQAGRQEPEDYTPDWNRIAAHRKADKDFRCEACGVDLTAHKALLHVHHRNGVKSDNRPDNLVVLCVSCHREQPYHDHMFVPHAHTQTINRLRREQGLLGNRQWDEVQEYCDPSLRGLLDACRQAGTNLPEVGLDVQDAKGAVVASLEIGWPGARVGVAITDADREGAQSAGWRVWRMIDALEDILGFVEQTG